MADKKDSTFSLVRGERSSPVPQAETELKRASDIYMNPENPASFYNFLPIQLRKFIAKELELEHFQIEGAALSSRAKANGHDWGIRRRLWTLFYLQQTKDTFRSISVEELVDGICPASYLYSQLDHKQIWKIVFWTTPIPKYQDKVLDLLQLSFSRIEEMLNLPMVDEKGKVDRVVIAAILRAATMMDLRVHGNYMQRILQKTDSRIQIHEQISGVPGSGKDTARILEEKIKELESKLQYLPEGSYIGVSETESAMIDNYDRQPIETTRGSSSEEA